MRTNAQWIDQLSSQGVEQSAAIEELSQILLRGAIYTFVRNSNNFQNRTYDEIVKLAEDSAQEALISVLDHLADFRGDSKFTTWAYKFAVNNALATARRAHWRNISLDNLLHDVDTYEWLDAGSDASLNPEQQVQQSEMVGAIKEIIQTSLTPRQQKVLKLMVFDDVPMDVVVERLSTNRNAIYKLLHDARKKVRQQLEAHGYSISESLSFFDDGR